MAASCAADGTADLEWNDIAKTETFKALNGVDHEITLKSDAVNDGLGRIEQLLASVRPRPTTEKIKGRVVDRAIANRGPYHRAKNSVGDAVIIEIYADLVSERNSRSMMRCSSRTT